MRSIITVGMMAAGLAFTGLTFAGGAALAQTPTPAPATAPMASGPLTLDTPIEQIAANPAGKAVLDKDMPGLTTHAMYDQFKSMSLKDLQPMSQGAISDEALKKAGDDLAKVKPQ